MLVTFFHSLPGSFAALALLASPAASQTLVKNVNQVPFGTTQFPTNSSPSGFVEAGGRLYFSASTVTTGREYFWVDGSGSPPQLLADVAPGAADSDPQALVELPNGLLLFSAGSTYLDQLWVSDGTAAGTTKLLELPSDTIDEIDEIVIQGGVAYFFAGAKPTRGLWRSDGTVLGTEKVFDLGFGDSIAADESIGTTGAMLFFGAREAGSAWRVWTTDGTAVGTELLIEVLHPTANISDFAIAGSNAVWAAEDDVVGRELWVSDGTVSGTQAVDIALGTASSSPAELTTIDDDVYFRAWVVGTGAQVYRTDGTVSGTSRVTDFANSTSLSQLANLEGQLFFTRFDGSIGTELWTTTGALGGESLYADFSPGPQSSYPNGFIAFAGGVLTRASTPETGPELFFSAGTPQTTGLVADIGLGTSSDASDISELTVFGSSVYFSATGFLGEELWTTDGTGVGTQIYFDLAASPLDFGSNPDNFFALGDRFIFTADNGIVGREFWVSDGTSEGTKLLREIVAGSDGIGSNERYFKVGSKVYFAADDDVHGTELWVTDGTTEGTRLVRDLAFGPASSYPWFVGDYQGIVYFWARNASWNDKTLWRTDGTAAGTYVVSSVSPHPTQAAYNSVEHQGLLYFAARQGDTGTELWRTDGTTAGTQLVAALTGGYSLNLGVSLGDYVYFQASDASNELELWRSDGTSVGTELFADLKPAGSSSPTGFERIGDRFVFSADDGTGRHFFSSDGIVVEQLSFAPSHQVGQSLYFNGEKLIGKIITGTQQELWGTDGTLAGSGVIAPLHQYGPLFEAWRMTSGPNLYYSARDDSAGFELFVTDGTAAGTHIVADLNPGPGDGWPVEVVRLGDTLYMSTAQDVSGMGRELYSLPLSAAPDWVAEPYGQGCAGSDGTVPSIGSSGTAVVGDTLTLEISDGAPSSVAAFYYSLGFTEQAVGDCTLFVDTPVLLDLVSTDVTGAASLPVGISGPELAGISIWLQGVVLDPGGGFIDLLSLTSAIEVLVMQ